MTSPATLAAGLRIHAQGLCCLEAAAELLIAQSWLHRADFTSRFITVRGIGAGQPAAVIDWPAAVAALGSSLPCSGGEQRMLKITASLADGILVDLRDTLTGLDDSNIQLLITAIRHAAGKSCDQVTFMIIFSSEKACTRGTPASSSRACKVVRSPDLPRLIFLRTRRSSAHRNLGGRMRARSRSAWECTSRCCSSVARPNG